MKQRPSGIVAVVFAVFETTFHSFLGEKIYFLAVVLAEMCTHNNLEAKCDLRVSILEPQTSFINPIFQSVKIIINELPTFQSLQHYVRTAQGDFVSIKQNWVEGILHVT